MDIQYWIDNTLGSVYAPSAFDAPLKEHYNQTLFKKEGLENDQHTLKVEILSINATLLV